MMSGGPKVDVGSLVGLGGAGTHQFPVILHNLCVCHVQFLIAELMSLLAKRFGMTV